MIKNKKDLEYYILQDRKMNGFGARRSLTDILKEAMYPNAITFLRYMRKLEYYKNTSGILHPLFKTYFYFKYRSLVVNWAIRLG